MTGEREPLAAEASWKEPACTCFHPLPAIPTPLGIAWSVERKHDDCSAPCMWRQTEMRLSPGQAAGQGGNECVCGSGSMVHGGVGLTARGSTRSRGARLSRPGVEASAPGFPLLGLSSSFPVEAWARACLGGMQRPATLPTSACLRRLPCPLGRQGGDGGGQLLPHLLVLHAVHQRLVQVVKVGVQEGVLGL